MWMVTLSTLIAVSIGAALYLLRTTVGDCTRLHIKIVVWKLFRVEMTAEDGS